MIRKERLPLYGFILGFSCGIAGLSPTAFAASGSDTPQQARLTTAGTDFASPQSVAHLRSRVRHAARDVCAPDWDGRALPTPEETRCYYTALNDGAAQIDTRQLAALHQPPVAMAAAQPADHAGH